MSTQKIVCLVEVHLNHNKSADYSGLNLKKDEMLTGLPRVGEKQNFLQVREFWKNVEEFRPLTNVTEFCYDN